MLIAGEDVEPALLAEVSTLGHPPRVIGVFRRREPPVTADATLALWRVSDPGNVGTLLRAADAFGAGVMLSEGCVADGGEPLDSVDLDRYSTFVLGAEREGLPEDVLARCDVKATIPTSQVESLNVAMAGTIVLYERSRKSGV